MKATWAFVVIGLVVASTLPANAASKAKVCKEQCGGLIAACSATAGTFGFGDLAKSCRKSVSLWRGSCFTSLSGGVGVVFWGRLRRGLIAFPA